MVYFSFKTMYSHTFLHGYYLNEFDWWRTEVAEKGSKKKNGWVFKIPYLDSISDSVISGSGKESE